MRLCLISYQSVQHFPLGPLGVGPWRQRDQLGCTNQGVDLAKGSLSLRKFVAHLPCRREKRMYGDGEGCSYNGTPSYYDFRHPRVSLVGQLSVLIKGSRFPRFRGSNVHIFNVSL